MSRFVSIDDSEVYYITDTDGLKTLDEYIKEFSKPEYEFDEEEVLRVAKEEYYQMIYENSMSAQENVDWLNRLYDENQQLLSEMSELGASHAEEINKIEDSFDKEILELEKKNMMLEQELKGMEELLQSYRGTIEHDAKLLADATRNGYLPPLEDWKEV